MSSFWLVLKQQWTIEEVSIFSNSSHHEWRAGLSDTNLKGTHPRTIPAVFGLIWVSGFRGEDLNVIFFQNMLNLHNRYISPERKISQKNLEYLINYSVRVGAVKIWDHFDLYKKQQWTIENISIFCNSSHLELRAELSYTILKGTTQGPSLPCLV